MLSSSSTSAAMRSSAWSLSWAAMVRSIQFAIDGICSGFRPRVVTPAVPRRMPDGSNGLRTSNGNGVVVQLDARAVERSRRRLAADQLRRQVDQDQVVVRAAGHQVEAALQQRVRQRLARSRRSCARTRGTPAAMPRAVPRRSRRWCGRADRPADRGRPPGRSPSRARRRVRIMAPRGPRNVLCVVVVITGACPTGDGCAPPATSPAMCAMSATRIAPTSFAISANAGKSIVRGIAVPPQKITFGRSASASARTSSRSTTPVSLRTSYWTARNHLPVAETLHPCVRWPPIGERHAHHGVAGLQERQVHGEVRRCSGERLDVGVVHAEQRLRPVDGELFDLVDDLLALVVPLAGVALGVLVREDRARRLEHGRRHVVLGRDHAQLAGLAAFLGLDQGGDLGIDVREHGAYSTPGTQAFGALGRRFPVVSSTLGTPVAYDVPSLVQRERVVLDPVQRSSGDQHAGHRRPDHARGCRRPGRRGPPTRRSG